MNRFSILTINCTNNGKRYLVILTSARFLRILSIIEVTNIIKAMKIYLIKLNLALITSYYAFDLLYKLLI